MYTHYKPPVSTLAERLSQAMSLMDITAADLSRETDITAASLSHYLNGRYVPKQDKIFKLARALNVNPAWLQGFDVPPEPRTPYGECGKNITESVLNKPDKTIERDDILNLANEINDMQSALVTLRSELQKIKSVVKTSDSKDNVFQKYLKLTTTNQQIINQTIDTLLKAQSTTSDMPEPEVM